MIESDKYGKTTYTCEHCGHQEYYYKWARTIDGVNLCNNCYREGEELSGGRHFSYDQYLFNLNVVNSFEKRKVAYLNALRCMLVERELNKAKPYKSFDKDGDMKTTIINNFLKEIFEIERSIGIKVFKKERSILRPMELTRIYDVITSKIKGMGVNLKSNEIKRVESDSFRWIYDKEKTY